MDLNFSKEDLDFQSEVREFLDKEYPKHIKEKMDNGDDLTRDEIVEWHKVVAKKGWMGAFMACRARWYWLGCYKKIYLP